MKSIKRERFAWLIHEGRHFRMLSTKTRGKRLLGVSHLWILQRERGGRERRERETERERLPQVYLRIKVVTGDWSIFSHHLLARRFAGGTDPRYQGNPLAMPLSVAITTNETVGLHTGIPKKRFSRRTLHSNLFLKRSIPVCWAEIRDTLVRAAVTIFTCIQ